MVQALEGRYDDIAIAHLCHVTHMFHVVTVRHCALLLKLSVKHLNARFLRTAPELLVDDAQCGRV